MTPLVTFNQFIKNFPNTKLKGKKLAKRILPLYPSPKLAEIIAAVLTDGHIDWYTHDNYPRARKILLYSDDKEECKWFLRTCQSLFEISGDIQKYNSKTGYSRGNSYKAVIHNATLAKILILTGVPAGNKTKTGYEVPKWIMEGDNETRLRFLKVLFNFDGSVPNNKKDRPCSWQMQFTLNKEETLIENGVKFLEQIKKLLKEFGINCGEVIRHEDARNKYTLIISFSNQESIVNFYRRVGFMKHSKQKKLENAIIEIWKKGRVKSQESSLLLENLRKISRGDRKAIEYVNKILSTNYTYRQFEHFRRNEIKVPISIVAVIEKALRKEAKIPEWTRFLIQNFTSHSLP